MLLPEPELTSRTAEFYPILVSFVVHKLSLHKENWQLTNIADKSMLRATEKRALSITQDNKIDKADKSESRFLYFILKNIFCDYFTLIFYWGEGQGQKPQDPGLH